MLTATVLALLPTLQTQPEPPQDLPQVELTGDNLIVDRSCVIHIPKGLVIEDADGDGIVHIAAPGITVQFAEGSVLRGTDSGRAPDMYRGYGVTLTGQSGVTISGLHATGLWCGIRAAEANDLTIENSSFDDNRRDRLKSTPEAEDSSDWLWPHENDEGQWLSRYGAAMAISRSSKVTVHDCKVRRGQNGLILDRVTESTVYDNDFSFLSGWGLAMWRSSDNMVSRNALDFCIRGYSHDVYNRGQDSAGILMFEQCSNNTFGENSVTHGGDGFFAFAGKEALGEHGKHKADWYKERGHVHNSIQHNDFSYAAAHGLELTFSFRNRITENRFVGNAICGIWGGYSSDTFIAGNRFEANGDRGYGLERGGINIEHGSHNRIQQNTFKDNKCGIHLWWDDDAGLLKLPWAKTNGATSEGNIIHSNSFVGGELGIHLRGKSQTHIGKNAHKDATRTLSTESDSVVDPVLLEIMWNRGPSDYPGENRPVGAREHLQGRENIIMTEWQPWDHTSPLIQSINSSGPENTYGVYNAPKGLKIKVTGLDTVGAWNEDHSIFTVSSAKDGLHPYELRATAPGFEQSLTGTLRDLTWQVKFFEWTADSDPRESIPTWRELSNDVIPIPLPSLQFAYGGGGPSTLKLVEDIGPDHFGMIATTRVQLPLGKWQIETVSDDGVQVFVNGIDVINNWTWHPPKTDTGTFLVGSDDPVHIQVEHFEIDGGATFKLTINKHHE